MTAHQQPIQPKEVGIAYILWLLLGTFGAHRLYLGQTGTGIAQLVLAVVGILTSVLLIGLLPLAVVWTWVLIDAFLIPGMTREANGVTA